MPMSIVLRKEDGTEIDHSDHAIAVRSLPRLAHYVPMLAWLDPYGKTVFNGVQREALLEELRSANPETEDDRSLLDEIRRLCEAGRSPHRYLWIIGD